MKILTKKDSNIQTTNIENKAQIKMRTKVHGYLQHRVPFMLKGRHPYKPIDFKKMSHPDFVTVPVSEDVIPKMISNSLIINDKLIL